MITTVMAQIQIDFWVIFWLIIAIGFVAVELSTVTLTSIWFAAGGLAALIVAMCSGGPLLQIIVFVLVSLIALIVTRPLAKKFINVNKTSTNADRAIGEEVRVIETISNLNQSGMVVVHGQEWTARTEDDKEIIEPGEMVRVIRISGVKLLVERVKED